MTYREATLYFYTGTGNSYRVATWLAEAARDAGAAVTLRPIGAARPVEEIGQGESALLGLVMPTHGFTAPWAMLRFALRLPRRRSTRAVVIATRAGGKIGPLFTPGIEGTATCLIALILALKGCRCESCMRCMGYCPTRAVEANYLLGIGVYLLAALIPTSALLAWLTARAPALAFLSGTPRWVLESVYALVALGLLYPLLHFLLGVGWINRFFTFITPTHYYRRYHEPEATLKELE